MAFIMKKRVDLNSGESLGQDSEVEVSYFRLTPDCVWVPSVIFHESILPETEIFEGELVMLIWYNPIEKNWSDGVGPNPSLGNTNYSYEAIQANRGKSYSKPEFKIGLTR